MSKSRSTISKAGFYKEIGDFWDTHDLAGFWDRTKSVKFEVDIHSEVTYYALDSKLSEKVRSIAGKKEYR